jgi:hypothetical protein
MITLATLSLLSVLSPAAAPGANGTAATTPLPRIVATPTTIVVEGQQQKAKNPIAAAIRNAKPGDIVQIQQGVYPPFTIGFKKDAPWNAKNSGRPGQPITVRGVGTVRIAPGKSGDTIAISQQVPCGHFVFENLQIEPGNRAGIMFYKASGKQVYDGFKFYDCDILGSWDHLTARGGNSKWGVWGHSLKNFEFVGKKRPAEIKDIRHEHGFYLQNPKGDMLIENVHASRLGRTFCQFTARKGDGAIGVGNITVRNCVVEDVALAAGDNYKGGSAFTVAGRLTGTILFEGNSYRAGFDRSLHRLTGRGAPYGTAAFVAWDNRSGANGLLILRSNKFQMAPGCGDRPVVSIGGCREVRFEGRNHIVAGAAKTALEIDPLNGKGKPSNTPVAKVSVAPSTTVEGGAIKRLGKKASLAQLTQ